MKSFLQDIAKQTLAQVLAGIVLIGLTAAWAFIPTFRTWLGRVTAPSRTWLMAEVSVQRWLFWLLVTILGVVVLKGLLRWLRAVSASNEPPDWRQDAAPVLPSEAPRDLFDSLPDLQQKILCFLAQDVGGRRIRSEVIEKEFEIKTLIAVDAIRQLYNRELIEQVELGHNSFLVWLSERGQSIMIAKNLV